jgi:hypothetical protein
MLGAEEPARTCKPRSAGSCGSRCACSTAQATSFCKFVMTEPAVRERRNARCAAPQTVARVRADLRRSPPRISTARLGVPQTGPQNRPTQAAFWRHSCPSDTMRSADLIRRRGRLRTPGHNRCFSLCPQEINDFQDTERRRVRTPSKVPCGPLLKKMVCALVLEENDNS